ncbi:MAG: shikimate dehydrogenase [Chloroflexota bacterium]
MEQFNTVPRTQPTFYFIGVTTQQSSSMRVFPLWMNALGREEVVIEGVDMKLHDDPQNYRQVVEHIRADPLSLGGLVTTHKIDLLDACSDLFDELAPDAAFLGEVSSISKRSEGLWGHATDPSAGGKSLDAIIDPNYFGRTGGYVLCFGAGGSAAALAYHLINQPEPDDQPEKFLVVNRSQARLDRLRTKIERLETSIHFEYVLNEDPLENDKMMAGIPDGSIVVNATGMGKDRPGSPVSDVGPFPNHGIAWEYNYRGKLDFYHQALAQQESRSLQVEDGWVYFLHGWTQVIEYVLDLVIGPEQFEELGHIAATVR